MTRLLPLVLGILSTPALAVVIRHDVPDQKYRIPATEARALVDLPHEGHGVLIAPQWVVTVAHATQWHPVQEVMLNERCLKVERLIVHPGYKKLPDELTKGDAAPAMAFLAQSDDIALIKLAEPVRDVLPLVLYEGNDEVGKVMQLLGKGASGNGREGQDAHGQNRTQLRRAYNTIEKADGRWLTYLFDAGDNAHPLEGMSGNGDSGGPVLIEHHGQWQVAGLTSWTYASGPVSAWKPGKYGVLSHPLRVSRYLPWIRQTMAHDESAIPKE